MNVACVSDISLGYGSPQIIFLLRSLKEYFRCSGRPLAVEINQPERPPVHAHFPDIEFARLYTRIHPHSSFQFGKAEYVIAAARLLNERRPEILVIPNTFCVPVLFKLKYRPRLVLYYVLEMPSAYGFDSEEHGLNVAIRDKIDLLVHPEQNRAAAYLRAFPYQHLPNVIVYNVSPLQSQPPVPPSQRNGKILYQGTIHDRHTSGGYYLDPAVQRIPIDLYGLLEGYNEPWKQAMRAMTGMVQYRGYVSGSVLQRIRRQYSYSIVFWYPTADNTLYACPNKFFESIADGVPPITAPHPQTKMLTKRYQCGIVMEDWSLGSFTQALQQAVSLIGTPAYDRMVANCRRAHEEELNWETQFRKIAWCLNRVGLEQLEDKPEPVMAPMLVGAQT